MPVLSRSCLQGKSKGRAALICKLASHTLGRWGWTPLLLLTLGLYCIFPACANYNALHRELTAAYEVSGTATADVQLSQVLELETIARATPLLSMDVTLSSDTFEQQCRIQCVTAQYAARTFLEGNVFPEESSMPYLILNRWASEHFMDQESGKCGSAIHAGDGVTLQLAEECRQAMVCGIFEDGSETPAVYMSYSLAARGLPTSSEFLITLLHKGDLERAALMLQREGVRISYDASLIDEWEMRQEEAVRTALVSLVLLLCSGVLTTKEVPFSKDEQYLLRLSGLTMAEVIRAYQLQIVFGISLCFLTALLLGAVCSEASLLSAALCALTAVLHGAVILQRNSRQIETAKKME